MHRKTFILYAVPGALAIIFLLAGIYLMPKINPYFAGAPQISRNEAKQIVDNFIQEHNFDVSDFFVDPYFTYDQGGLDYLMRTNGVEPTIAMAREEELPLSSWRFFYYRNTPRGIQEETYEFRVSPSGKMLGFRHRLPDSVSGANLSTEEAIAIAQDYLKTWPEADLNDFTLDQTITDKKAGRTDYRLLYKRQHRSYGEGAEAFSVGIAGDKVVQVIHHFQDPADFATTSGVAGTLNVLLNTASVVVYIILTILLIAVFLKRYHAGEISVRQGFKAAALLFIFLFLFTVNMWGVFAHGVGIGPVSYLQTKLITLGLQMVTTWTFMAINVMAGWNVGFHATRKLKPRLLSGIDSILQKRWLTRNIGREVPIGFVYGTIIFGGVQVIIFLLIKVFGVVPRLGLDSAAFFSMYIPVIGVFGSVTLSALFGEVVFSLFLVTLLIRKLKSPGAAIAITGFLFAVFSLFFNDTYSLWPAYASLLPMFFIGVLQAFVFWRHGLLAAFTSAGLFAAYSSIGPMLASEHPFFIGNAIVVIAILLAFLGMGLAGLLKGKLVEFAVEDEPEHIRRIKEQTRLQKELEIARRVQLGLLPKEQPALSGFDISGICIPALEVGGDYFDFITLGNGELGIAVGDVSGKGVPAAIYMTLTKGILQSHAESTLSPKQVLSKVNNLMYRTIERSWYVSMFYAVLDSGKRTLRYARAGHNPAIMLNKQRGEPQLLQTAGIGLGLDIGEIFTKTLVEGELKLEAGDTLVFYTDGFTEAMNGNGEEFGEDRFLDLLDGDENGSAEGLLKKTISSVREFAGNAPQHDDMTMVVLKVY
ncbi:MAG: PP2C family protein-serine/threonine phosphatase [bacterium]